MSLAYITTIQALRNALLKLPDGADYGSVMQRYTASLADLEGYCTWHAKHYTRTCIHRDARFELLAVCYEVGQTTSIHDYDSQRAWVFPVMGELTEERFRITASGGLERMGRVRLQHGNGGSFLVEQAIHRFMNDGPGRAVTLNLYAKPMHQWRVYDERTGAYSIANVGPAAI